jgi:large subunit ribosomal protein L31
MKPKIHPDYHEITVKMTNGTTFKTRSTYGKKGDVLQLDVDPNTHPAWTGGGAVINEKAGRIAAFNSKFGSIGGAKKSAQQDDTKKKEEVN